MYAKWTANPSTVTLNGDITTTAGTTSVTAIYGNPMPSITIPTRTGYTFMGYFALTNGNGTQYYNAEGGSAHNWDIIGDATLYAHWNPSTYTITFDMQSGSGGTTSVTATYGNILPDITVPSRSDFIFCGYFTSTDGGGTCYYQPNGKSAGIWNKTTATTLYAYWASATAQSYSYNGGIQTYTAPVTGIYKLEAYGSGGATRGLATGGSGGYSVGYAKLNAGETLYIGVGGMGSSTSTGYNGGGIGGGGGATHIAKVTGTLSAIGAANISKVLIVAGGGSGGVSYYNPWNARWDDVYGANGGGSSGANGLGTWAGTGGTQSGGYAFGIGGDGGTDGCGGGGGLYGGTAGKIDNASAGGSGGGGSGYIGGVAAFTYNGVTYNPSMTVGGGSPGNQNGKVLITFESAVNDDFKITAPEIYLCAGEIQTYTVPVTGIYKLEAYGSGGATRGNATGGSGGYSIGYAKLNAGETLYIGVGGMGSGTSAGYNGGGIGGGGGATHIAKVTGTLSEIGAANISNVLIVAGGGSGGVSYYNPWNACWDDFLGSNGGGSSGANGLGISYCTGTGGTQSSGYAFGIGEDGGTDGCGAGGGLYGGTAGKIDNAGAGGSGGGGSGYIGGVASFTYNGVTYNPSMTVGGGSPGNQNGKVLITFITD